MNTTYYRTEVARIVRDPVGLFFTAGLPAFFYLLFGASPDYGQERIADNGNVAMWIMIAMAAYGAVTATVNIGGTTSLEPMQGWTRQLGLTPLQDKDYVAVKSAVAVTIAAIPVAIVYLVGYFTGAEGRATVWALSAAIVLFGAATFALYGLAFGMAFRSEAAVSAAGGSIVIFGFLGNVFIPLTGWQLAIAKFTPLYGYVSLARYPLTGGTTIDTETGELVDTALWQSVANVVIWTIVLGVAASYLVRRSRTR